MLEHAGRVITDHENIANEQHGQFFFFRHSRMDFYDFHDFLFSDIDF